MLNGAEAHPIQSATRALFDRYEREFNAGLTGEADLEAVAALYAACFIAASPAGVFTGKNDEELRRVSAKGFKHYRDTGVQRMNVRNLDISAIDELHGLARVAWRAIYKVEGAQKVIDFTNVYLVRLEGGTAKVFGWITGDEAEVLRQHGIG